MLAGFAQHSPNFPSRSLVIDAVSVFFTVSRVLQEGPCLFFVLRSLSLYYLCCSFLEYGFVCDGHLLYCYLSYSQYVSSRRMFNGGCKILIYHAHFTVSTRLFDLSAPFSYRFILWRISFLVIVLVALSRNLTDIMPWPFRLSII